MGMTMTVKALAVCLFSAAHTYAVPVDVLLGIMHVEGGRVGQMVRNTNGTYDLGPMQINTIWIPKLSAYWGISRRATLRMVRDDACTNVGVAAWILRTKIDDTGTLAGGIAGYHSMTPELGGVYRMKVVRAMENYTYVHRPEDLIYAAEQRGYQIAQR